VWTVSVVVLEAARQGCRALDGAQPGLLVGPFAGRGADEPCGNRRCQCLAVAVGECISVRGRRRCRPGSLRHVGSRAIVHLRRTERVVCLAPGSERQTSCCLAPNPVEVGVHRRPSPAHGVAGSASCLGPTRWRVSVTSLAPSWRGRASRRATSAEPLSKRLLDHPLRLAAIPARIPNVRRWRRWWWLDHSRKADRERWRPDVSAVVESAQYT
jgi:hypothetical protein